LTIKLPGKSGVRLIQNVDLAIFCRSKTVKLPIIEIPVVLLQITMNE